MYGVSTQDTDYQAEAQQRLHLPFPLLSDSSLQLTHALKLPTFKVGRWAAAHLCSSTPSAMSFWIDIHIITLVAKSSLLRRQSAISWRCCDVH